MCHPEVEKREQARFEFVRRYLPEGVRCENEFLFGVPNTCDYVPNADELTGCLRAYHDLLKAIPRSGGEFLEVMLIGMLEASELSLSMLGRATSADRATLAREMGEELVHEIEFILTGIERFEKKLGMIGKWSQYDGLKRIRWISELLKDSSNVEREHTNAESISAKGVLSRLWNRLTRR